MFIRHFLLAGLLAGASCAQADTVIFTDDFDSTVAALNKTVFPGGWTVANGTVDVIGTNFIDVFPGNGNYVDLDGSTGDAGELSKSLALTGGLAYTATFSLAGSHRGGTDIVDVMFGTASASFTLAGADPFSPSSLVFTPAASGKYTLTFANRGGDNLGALLDKVSVTVIPEPSGYAMMLAGLAGIGFLGRRRGLQR